MPVDFLPLIIGAAFFGTLLLTAMIAGYAKRRRRVWLLGLLLAAIWPTFYVWLYHRTEFRYSRTAAAGDVEAMYWLGRSYMSYNRGSPYDPPQGRELLRRAAEQGHVPAQMTLGSYFLSGLSTPHDQNEALRLFRRAADQGNQEAKTIIDDVKQNGFNVDHPTGKAAQIVMKWLYE
jgi:TPR repeat protein